MVNTNSDLDDLETLLLRLHGPITSTTATCSIPGNSGGTCLSDCPSGQIVYFPGGVTVTNLNPDLPVTITTLEINEDGRARISFGHLNSVPVEATIEFQCLNK